MPKLSWNCRVAGMAMAVLVLAALSGCGSEDGTENGASAAEKSAGEGIQKIRPSSQIYVVEDLTSFGFKKARTYDVEGLPEAVAAYYGFWGLDPYKRADYEIRFYTSHEDAVEFGSALAEERIGREAKLTA